MTRATSNIIRPGAPALPHIQTMSRPQIEEMVEALIARLDAMDGDADYEGDDCDLESDLADDHGGRALEICAGFDGIADASGLEQQYGWRYAA